MISSSILTSCTLPSVTRINVGMLPRRSSRVCILTAALRRTKPGPRKQRQAQIDGCRIQGIQAPLQIDAHGLSDIQAACGCNQPLPEVGEDAPVPRFVRIRQRRASHLATESQMIQFALQRTQTSFVVAQTFPIGQLGEGHRQILIPTAEASQPEVALITLDATTELPVGKKVDKLREDGAALVHEPLSALREFKSRQARNGLNLLRGYYLQQAPCNSTRQQCSELMPLHAYSTNGSGS